MLRHWNTFSKALLKTFKSPELLVEPGCNSAVQRDPGTATLGHSSSVFLGSRHGATVARH